MSLDLSLICGCCKRAAFETNITHNLGKMFRDAGVYDILWHGDDRRAGEQVAALEAAVTMMEADPERFSALSASNGWGTYEQALPWLREVVTAFKEYPDATLRCSR